MCIKIIEHSSRSYLPLLVNVAATTIVYTVGSISLTLIAQVALRALGFDGIPLPIIKAVCAYSVTASVLAVSLLIGGIVAEAYKCIQSSLSILSSIKKPNNHLQNNQEI